MKNKIGPLAPCPPINPPLRIAVQEEFDVITANGTASMINLMLEQVTPVRAAFGSHALLRPLTLTCKAIRRRGVGTLAIRSLNATAMYSTILCDNIERHLIAGLLVMRWLE